MNDGDDMSFAQRLHDLRIRHGLSLQDVASRVSMSKAHVWNLEKGISDNPTVEVLTKLADLFQVRIADLVGENPQAEDEAPEMVAMFRDLKRLDVRDRETIRVLIAQMARPQAPARHLEPHTV